ncbi:MULTISPECIES: class I SAM-dependent methyltransferase [Mycolicibacter]|uniref:Class I SAM-dependent methyltransferase n=1 Tax=[Mycobacterium] vasticus TaxID=2875777 RepID=A0ABU5Z4G4_9MYCO|nr:MULTISPECIES: class I SAM-dependent methyltransferase [unclassified Mycolicibacter]MEB3065738.1 class I SAM-dependent methyltransferase [Mycolicibacter sp. MYC101]MEB3071760.1 class I SAM-dependent methyltransferase [Mycolicibacter sp. MYC017]
MGFPAGGAQQTIPLLLPGAEVFTQALDTIPGWFYPQDVRLFDFVLNCQLENDIRGDVLEVGAYQGKSAILLAYGLRGDENLVVCDLFGLSPDNFDLPAEGMNAYSGLTIDSFYNNYDRFHARRPVVEVCPSAQLEDRVGRQSCRFIHIDGSHAYKCVRDDIRTAVNCSVKNAVIALDDYRSPHTPGVSAAIWEAAASGIIFPFCITPSKLYAAVSRTAQKEWFDEVLRLTGVDSPWGYEVHQVLGVDLLRVG